MVADGGGSTRSLEPAEDLLGLAHMRQKKARVDEGERTAFEVMRVGGFKFDRPYTCLPRVLARKLEHMRVEIDAENMTLGPDDLSHVERDMTAAAANVEDPVAALEPGVFKEQPGCLAHDVREQVKPPLPVLAAGDRISVRRGATSTGQAPAPLTNTSVRAETRVQTTLRP
jgi:hypothetical protein